MPGHSIAIAIATAIATADRRRAAVIRARP